MIAARHWTESLLPGSLRQRACEVLRHDDTDAALCPLADADLALQAGLRLQELVELAEAPRVALLSANGLEHNLTTALDLIEQLEAELRRRDTP